MTAGTDPDWHALTPEQAASALAAGPHGLTSDQVAPRRRRYGRNALPEEPPPSPLRLLLRQFRSPLIYILLAATVITLLLREYLDAVVITLALVINATIGFFQERRAEHAVRALSRLLVPRSRVIRDRREQEVDSRELVPGDVVLLEPGARVPADLRLLAVTGLRVDESLLTGESTPVDKRVASVPVGAALADRRSMAYTGAIVTSGRATGLVVGTGERTELGAIVGMIRGERRVETPLQRRMVGFARLIGLVVAVAAVVAFGSGLALGRDVGAMFLVAVALAVAAVPEGLPIAVTVAMALGVRRMARRRAIIRRLPAVETLGSTTVIGSDKTGTLTENRMTVQEVWAGGRYHRPGDAVPAGSVLHQALLTGVLTNEAEAYATPDGLRSTGDPTEVALLVAAMRAGIAPAEVRAEYDRFAEVPFESERRYSASVRQRDGHQMVFAKGAPERILAMCSHRATGDGVVRLDAEAVREVAADLAGRGLRVLAVAARSLPEPLPGPDRLAEPDQLILLGLVGLLDPPRPGVAGAVADCRAAGVRVIMITGDHAATARAIAARLGIAAADAEVLVGAQLDQWDDAALAERVRRVSVYARVAPEHKLRVVRALRRQGEVVAVTGDGANDAPALKAAAIGVAMGRAGTDVAREAADMVLADDNFVTIVNAVAEGRGTFENIRKVTFFLVSIGVAAVLAILFGLWLGWPLVMVPAQLLWLNIAASGVQDVALAFEPHARGVLRRPPRSPGEGVLSRLLWWRTALVAAVMAAGTLLMFRWQLDRGGSLAEAQTVALSTMVVFQALHVGNCRSTRRSVFRLNPFANRFLLLGTVISVGLHVAAVYAPPTQWLLRLAPIDGAAWIRIVAVAISVVVVVEVEKWLRRRWPVVTRTRSPVRRVP